MSHRKLLSRVAIVVMAVPLTLSPSAGAQDEKADGVAVEAPRQVTTGTHPLRLYDIPALAVDPRNSNTVVMAVGDARNGGCGLRVSRDGGLSWATTVENLLPEPSDYCIQRAFGPVMAPAFASDGTLYVAMPRSNPATDFANGPIGLVVARTKDLGVTHETFTVAKGETTTINPADYGSDAPTQEGNSWHKFPSLVVDPTNPQRLFLAWRWTVWGKDLRALTGDVPFRPWFATSEDGGKTWTKPVDLLTVGQGEKAFGASAPVLVMKDDTIYGFSKELTRSAPAGQPRPKARLLMFKSTDAGQSWTTSVFNEGAQAIGNPQPAIDADSGRLHVAYEARGAAPPTGSPPNPQNIFFQTSSDGGRTWTEPLDITDDPPQRRLDQYYPGIAVGPDGRVDIAWHDFRNDPFFFPGETGNMGTAVSAKYWDVYYAYSTDSGATWSNNIRVTNPSINADRGGTFNNIDTRGPIGLASTKYAAYVAWADSRASDGENEAEDAYVSRVRFTGLPELGASVSAPSAFDNLLWAVMGAGIALALGGLAFIVVGRRTGRPRGEGAAVAAQESEPARR